jgi:ABC-type amino acid transport substrate-binding protein
LRGAKYALTLAIGFILTMMGCGERKKEIPRAAVSMNKYNVVRIATYPIAAPFEFGKETGVQGFDVDIGAEIGKTLRFEVKWVKAFKYDQLFDYLRNGDAEIAISSVPIDPKMTNEFSFSHPYYDSWDIIAIQRGRLDIKGLDDLSDKNVGVAVGRPGDALMSSRKSLSLKKYATLDDALGGLNRAEIHAVVGDEPFLNYGSATSFTNTRTRQDRLNKYQYAVVVRKTEPELLAKINETIDRMKASGEIDKLFGAWMGNKRTIADELLKKDIQKAEEDARRAALEAAPKTIEVTINKTSGNWNPDRLDGFRLVLASASGKFESSPIIMNGNKGHCKFTTAIPPGEYTLTIDFLKMTAKVPVPRLAKTALTMDLNVGLDANILLR